MYCLLLLRRSRELYNSSLDGDQKCRKEMGITHVLAVGKQKTDIPGSFYMFRIKFNISHLLWVKFAFNPILTGLFESKFLLGGGGGQFEPPFRSRPQRGRSPRNFAWMSRQYCYNFLPKTVYLLYYYNLCKLDEYYHIFMNISNK